MKEPVVFLHDKSGTDRIHKFEDAGYEEGYADQISAKSFCTLQYRIHITGSPCPGLL